MKCTDLLIQEHKIILRAMDVLDHMATRVENSQPVAPEDVETLLRFLRGFADDHHQAQEESALFPELMRTSAWHEDPDRKSTRLNSSHGYISYAVFCLKKKKK